jgi:hypothetical protein
METKDMTFWQLLVDNKTKILGTLTTIVASLLSMIALGMFAADASSPALLEPLTIRWMTIFLSLLNIALGGGTIAAGIANTTSTKVAEAKAQVASALTTALHATPPPRTE